ncbi:MAG: nucleotide exchange factor GrpE [Chloroflexi bacterium]|nr:nucleotide exchange factor GrpE [Chloroflexota bacterium]
MSNKKEKTRRAETGDESVPEAVAGPAAGVIPEAAPEPAPALDELQKQLAECQSQAAEFKDGWQRSLADFTNYKRRTDQERVQMYQNAVGDIAKRYLPIMDDLERALQNKPADPWAGGIELIYRKLQGILEAEGLQRIEAEGRVFDPSLHEAISQEPAEGVGSGAVIGVVQQGYMLGERVIRPALVRVAQ